MVAEALIRSEGVSKVYETPSEQVFAVKDAGVAIERGEFVCLMGPSGCGKSTLIGLLAGLDRPTSGDVFFDGQLLANLTGEERAKIRLRDLGMVFQVDHLIPEFDARENVALPLELLGWAKTDALDEAESVLNKVGLRGLERRFPSELSGGQRQRVGIARAIAGPRKALIADEATGSLDHANSQAIFALLRELADQGYAVLAATHDQGASAFADRTLIMRDGQVLLAGFPNSEVSR